MTGVGALPTYVFAVRVVTTAIVIASLWSVGCASEDTAGRPVALESLQLDRVCPQTILPGSQIVIEGESFVDEPVARSWLSLVGAFEGAGVDVQLPAVFEDFGRLRIDVDPSVLATIGPTEGDFEGALRVVVDYAPDRSRHESAPVHHTFSLVSQLQPQLLRVLESGAVYVNDAIDVEAEGLLLQPGEGVTVAVIRGCFVPASSTQCDDVGEVARPVLASDREHGTFTFSPDIVGIGPGRFEGTVRLRNEHAVGGARQSAEHTIAYEILEPAVSAISPVASVGQYLEISGGGFVGVEPGAITVVHLDGELRGGQPDGPTLAASVSVVPTFVGGRTLRYALDEDDELGALTRDFDGLRKTDARFEGTLTAVVQYDGHEFSSRPQSIAFDIEPVKQVVWVKFAPSYVEGLSAFGLRALDGAIRDRIFAVLRRDYATANIEFRETEPTDFELYATVEIAGEDPNGLGLLGYDNTHGKDNGNVRLHDRIGGVNAKQQEDGHAGYGGVFVASLFTFSQHPPSAMDSQAPDALFDAIFDPFRPDVGKPVSSLDENEGRIPTLEDGTQCPGASREQAAACAVWALGSLVGSTTSHELGHSLGLADPGGLRPHNLGDGVDRIMDEGGARPFAERAQLQGMGPAVFCDRAYAYLREILPTDEPETTFDRPRC